MVDANAARFTRATTPEIEQARYFLRQAMALMERADWLSPGAEDTCQDAMSHLDQTISGLRHAIAADAEHMREKGI